MPWSRSARYTTLPNWRGSADTPTTAKRPAARNSLTTRSSIIDGTSWRRSSWSADGSGLRARAARRGVGEPGFRLDAVDCVTSPCLAPAPAGRAQRRLRTGPWSLSGELVAKRFRRGLRTPPHHRHHPHARLRPLDTGPAPPSGPPVGHAGEGGVQGRREGHRARRPDADVGDRGGDETLALAADEVEPDGNGPAGPPRPRGPGPPPPPP